MGATRSPPSGVSVMTRKYFNNLKESGFLKFDYQSLSRIFTIPVVSMIATVEMGLAFADKSDKRC
jgi:hypothetical protein